MKFRVLSTTVVLSLGFAMAVAILAGSPSFQKQEKYFFQVDLTSSVGGVAQLFYDIGSGYIEKDSVAEPVSRDRMARYRFPLPHRKISGLRFDPVNDQAQVTLSAPAIVDSKGAIVHRFNSTDFKAGPHIKSMDPQKDRLTVLCTEGGVDPFLIADLPFRIGPPFVTKEWLRAIIPVGASVFSLVIGIAFACSTSRGGTVLGAVTNSLHARPLLTLLTFSAVGVLLQFHPLFFATPRSNLAGWSSSAPQTSIVNLTTYNLSHNKLGASPPSPLAWADVFSLAPKLVGSADWAVAAGILTAWWAYVFGCGLLAWLMVRSLSTAVIIAGCALLSRVWTTGVLPLSTPAIAAAPWLLMAWGAVATAPKSSRLFYLAGAAILFANLEMFAAEFSLRVVLLAITAAVVGTLFIGLQPQPRSSRLLRAGVGLGFSGLFAAFVVFAIWRATLSGHVGAETAKAVFQEVPASAHVSFFEGFLWQDPRTFLFPSVSLVVLAGLAWAFTRLEENFQKPSFVASALAAGPLAVLAAGALSNEMLAAWYKHATTAKFQEAAWYVLVFFSTVLASFGFAGLRQFCAAPSSGLYIAKATLLFFIPFLTYFGTFSHHAEYTFRSAYLISIIIGWAVAHFAMVRLRNPPETRVLALLVSCVVMLAWWHRVPYVHLFIGDALSAP